MNTITIELCKEDRARLDKIIEALEQSRPVEINSIPVTHPVESDAPQTEPEVPVKAQEEAVEAPTEKIDEVSLSDIQKKVVELSAAGKKAEVRDVITKYANRVSAIPAEHTAEVWNQLIRLEN